MSRERRTRETAGEIFNESLQSILVDLAVLHDHDDILCGIRNELDIGQRITVNN
jgi:hypothetical protein